jgi:hypothetical protein
MVKLMRAALTLTWAACTTVQTGSYATTIDSQGHVTEQQVQPSGIQVSGKQVKELASRYLGMLVITFENPKPSWRRIHNVRVSLSPRSLHQSVVIPAGAELNAWVDAILATSYYGTSNLSIVFRELGLRDWSQRVTRNRQPLREPSAESGLNTIATLLAHPETPQTYPPDHLLEGPIIVPPKLFAKRWLVLNTPADQATCIKGIDLEFDVDAADEATIHERVWVAFDNQGSDWQLHFCGNPK